MSAIFFYTMIGCLAAVQALCVCMAAALLAVRYGGKQTLK